MLDEMTTWAREAGNLMMSYQKGLKSLDVGRKNPRDLVTQADKEVEVFLIKNIMAKDSTYGIFGEEGGVSGDQKRRWIIDPIDGTASFVHGQPNFSLSLAYEENGVLRYGLVYAPAMDELYTAEKGKGAFRNGEVIKVRENAELLESIIGTGFACHRDQLERNNLQILPKLLPSIRDIRRYGSAALDCAYVASGRLDAFYELNLNLYDVAAGILLVEEAGGRISDFSDGDIGDCSECLFSNDELHEKLLEILNPFSREHG
jgi:myo-inositol-1(or 4)-monophosphatase